ncbi:hypothetical protein U9M48_015572, partial [Paspalum notatum var. saurae]
ELNAVFRRLHRTHTTGRRAWPHTRGLGPAHLIVGSSPSLPIPTVVDEQTTQASGALFIERDITAASFPALPHRAPARPGTGTTPPLSLPVPSLAPQPPAQSTPPFPAGPSLPPPTSSAVCRWIPGGCRLQQAPPSSLIYAGIRI